MKRLPCELIISRVTSNTEPHQFMRLTLTDQVSGVAIVEAAFSMAEFMAALTSTMGYGEAEWRPEFLGKRRETKFEMVLIPSGPGKLEDSERRAREAVSRYEVDGWRGRISDAMNHHTRVGVGQDGSVHRVTFTRFVEPE